MINPRFSECGPEILIIILQCHTLLLTPTIDPFKGEIAHLMLKLPQASHVSADSKIIVMSNHLSLQNRPPGFERHSASYLF